MSIERRDRRDDEPRRSTFSPASSGRVHILVTASRALLAWIVHMPGRPLLSAMSRSRLSAWRTSPTMSRLGPHPQRLLDEAAQRHLAGALEAGLAALDGGDVAQRDLELESCFTLDLVSSPRRAFIYTRISLDRTGEGLGVERQLKACRTKAKALGWTVVEVFEENDTSASKGRRPVYADMMRRLQEGEADALVAWSIDRLTRRP